MSTDCRQRNYSQTEESTTILASSEVEKMLILCISTITQKISEHKKKERNRTFPEPRKPVITVAGTRVSEPRAGAPESSGPETKLLEYEGKEFGRLHEVESRKRREQRFWRSGEEEEEEEWRRG